MQRDETETMLADAVQDVLAHEQALGRLRSLYEGRAAYDRGFWRQMAQQGWLSLRLSEAQGGSGLEAHHAGAVAEGLGRHVVPEPFIACAVMPSVLALSLPTEASTAAWQPVLDGLLTGEAVTTLAWQEQPQALTVTPPTTSARADGAEVLLQGRKHGIVAASWADHWVVSALFEGAPSLWCVPARSAGITLHEQLTSDGGQIAVADLADVRVPRQALLARGAGVQQALEAAVQEATLIACAQLCGVASQALAMTLEYLRTRVQFGKPIGSFQSLQHLAVDVRLQQALARASYGAALQRQAQAPQDDRTRAAIAAAKARASDAALQAGRFGVQAHGAIGFAAEADIGLYLKSALRLAAWLGNGTQQRQRFGELAATFASGEGTE